MKRFPFLALLMLMTTALACGGTAPTAEPEPTTAQEVVTPTELPPPTEPPTPTDTPAPTDTPEPTATITPTPGPIVIDDDFSTNTGRFKCDYCKVSDGVFYMGPYPSANSYEAYYAICEDCGIAKNYKMSVDTWYIEGPSDRGFGLLLREEDGYFIDLEILTWQYYGVFTFDPSVAGGVGWGAITDWFIPGPLKPGRAVNHIETVMKTDNNQMTLTVTINGKVARALNVDNGSGSVGLLVGMHSLGVAFDNFHFEELP